MATHNPAHIGLVPPEALGSVLIMDKGELVFQGAANDAQQWKAKLYEVLGIDLEQLKKLG
jgi:hypothetical protein